MIALLSAPLGKACSIVEDCHVIQPLSALEIWRDAGILAACGVLVLIGLGLLLDSSATRHAAIHWLRKSDDCGRCDDERINSGKNLRVNSGARDV